MVKRYQVFVSSTKEDLREERRVVLESLLKLRCIPAVMELFPEANDTVWSLIKRIIDDCDYYVVVVAGRYGDVAPDGKSYTQMEYKYAVEKGIQVLAFLHAEPEKLPANNVEKPGDGEAKLRNFKSVLKQHHCNFYHSPDDLALHVTASMALAIQDFPGVGWVRGNLVADESAAEEALRLRREIDNLRTELSQVSTRAPTGIDNLVQGSDPVVLQFELNADGTKRFPHKTTWNELFTAVGPYLLTPHVQQSAFIEPIRRAFWDKNWKALRGTTENSFMTQAHVKLVEEDLQRVKFQLRALGLVRMAEPAVNNVERWVLTPRGDEALSKLMAIRREGNDVGESKP